MAQISPRELFEPVTQISIRLRAVLSAINGYNSSKLTGPLRKSPDQVIVGEWFSSDDLVHLSPEWFPSPEEWQFSLRRVAVVTTAVPEQTLSSVVGELNKKLLKAGLRSYSVWREFRAGDTTNRIGLGKKKERAFFKIGLVDLRKPLPGKEELAKKYLSRKNRRNRRNKQERAP